MRILTKQEFIECPNGTVFVPYANGAIDGGLVIKIGQYEDNSGWNKELPIEPSFRHDKIESDYCYTNWCANDISTNDYDDNQLFAVFSKTEVIKIIGCFQWALTDCETFFDQDIWYRGDDIPFEDKDKES